MFTLLYSFRLEETFSHIAELLFKVEIDVRVVLTALSSTGEACKWNRAYRDDVNMFYFSQNSPNLHSQNSIQFTILLKI